MSPSVLGRDPFSRPEPSDEAPKPAAKRKPKRKARSKTSSAKATKARKTDASSSPSRRSPGEQGARPMPARAGPGEARRPEVLQPVEFMDRHDLLPYPERRGHPLVDLLRRATFFAQPSFYGQLLGDWTLRWHSQEVDSFGFDPVYWRSVQPIFKLLFERYWRVEVSGTEHIPRQGRVLLVANHSGSLPYDGIVLKLAVERHMGANRAVRFLVEDFVFHFPFLGPFINRIGGVRACQDNARRLLEFEQLVAVFPEGVKGIGKLFGDRYKLQRFGRGGFIKLALHTSSTIVPVAIVGAEEIHPMLSRVRWLARLFRLPYLPITPTFPWLGPLGLLPLPSKWMIHFGEPIDLSSAGPGAADDPLLVTELSERVRSTTQQMLDRLVQARGHAFLGPGGLDA
ncbi:MAG: acyltransferase family protein [Deltaproteobacteria bacterium]|nr:acyltransferase family protein [Deltaproteobacteria bacterium]